MPSISVGDLFELPLPKLAVRGVVIALAGHEGAWLFAAVDTFTATPTAGPEVALLAHQRIAEFPHRVAPHELAMGPGPRPDWTACGRAPLTAGQRDLAEAFVTWRTRSNSMFVQATAYDRLGAVGADLTSLPHAMAREWRCRFDLPAVLDEERARRALAEQRAAAAAAAAAELSWAKVAKAKPGRGYPRQLATTVRAAYATLVRAVDAPALTPDVVRAALEAFLAAVASSPHAGAYRDELAQLVGDVAATRGLSRADGERLAESLLA